MPNTVGGTMSALMMLGAIFQSDDLGDVSLEPIAAMLENRRPLTRRIWG